MVDEIQYNIRNSNKLVRALCKHNIRNSNNYNVLGHYVNILLIVFTATTSEILSFSAVVCVHIPLYTQPNSPIDTLTLLTNKETNINALKISMYTHDL